MPTLTALPAAIVARRAADLPHLVGPNLLERAATIAWRSTGSLAGGTDVTDLGYPGARAGDGRAAERTRPSTTAAAHYLCVDLGSAQAFDVAGLIGAWVLTGAATFAVEGADDAAFSVGLTTLVSGWVLNAVRARRIAWTLAGSAQTVTARYVRLVVTYATTGRVEVGELYLGQRLALPYRATLPTAPLERPERDEGQVWTSDGGLTTRGTAVRGRLFGPLEWSVDLADEASVLAWCRAVEWGRRSALYAARPLSEPHAAALVGAASIACVERLFGARELSMDLTEEVPTLSAEEL
jgi:hypothetical protein